MHSRAARLILVLLFFSALTTTAYLYWKGETLRLQHVSEAAAFDAAARHAEYVVMDLRSNQRGYVAAGQGSDFWIGKVIEGVEALRSDLAALRTMAVSPDAQSNIEQVSAVLNNFVKADMRAADYVRKENRLLASDVIFADGLELTGGVLASLEQARVAEAAARTGASNEARRRALFAIIAGAAAAALAVLLLVPTPAARTDEIAAAQTAALRAAEPDPVAAVMTSSAEGWSRPRRATELAEPLPISAGGTASVEQEMMAAGTDGAREDAAIEAPVTFVPDAAVATASVSQPATDFVGVAALCVDLARIVDTRAMPSLLDRAASILDASGIILWIADPDGRELNPIFAQGYPQQLVDRMGTIPRDAENATAAAFRTSLLQTVMADNISDGAIAAPLVTPGGCVGVMSAEVRHDAERHEMKLAAATIVAAQLATLVGPPIAKNHVRAGSAGA